MPRRSFPLSQVYGLLEPGPVVLLTTAHRGRANVMTLSWQTMMEFEPPLVALVVSGHDHSFAALQASRECVLAIPTVAQAAAVVGCGNTTGRRVDKFAAFGLTPLPARRVAAPLIAECPVNLECRVVDTRWVNRYNVFVVEVVAAWAEPGSRELATLHHRGRGRFMLAGRTLTLPSRMR